jgi:hypothetical protein
MFALPRLSHGQRPALPVYIYLHISAAQQTRQDRHSRKELSSTSKVGQSWSVCPSVDMLLFGVTIPATVPQRSEILEGLMK